MRRPPARLAAIGAAVMVVLAACAPDPRSPTQTPTGFTQPSISAVQLAGIHKIKHVIILMQENRSFDSYFGTYPGADGLPMRGGAPATCLPDPARLTCVRPYHDPSLINSGGPHAAADAVADIGGGRMDGFIARAEHARSGCLDVFNPGCRGIPSRVDVMGYHTASEIPNYWTWAHHFVLQDHLFPPSIGWSAPQHLDLVSGWSASCRRANDPMSCRGNQRNPGSLPGRPDAHVYPWTDLSYLLDRHSVSWRYYVSQGTAPDCVNGAMFCREGRQLAGTPSIWNPLPFFSTVRRDGQVGNVQRSDAFFQAAATGTLPSVSWVMPDGQVSEHPPASIGAGQAWTTRAIDAVMSGPNWSSSAIFLAWDDWGGFYDHLRPPQVDAGGYGIRVPGLIISPYARRGYIDHQILSFDAYLRFIEDDFLGGARLDPRTDGRPDSRPNVRETNPILGNLVAAFDFTQPPRPPIPLPLYPTSPPPPG